MVRAWYLNKDDETDTSKLLDLKEVEKATAVLCWQLGTGESDGTLDKIRKERGYAVSNVIDISPEGLPNYEEKVKSFRKEHCHDDEEVHFVLGGTAYFDVRSETDDWIRLQLFPGDLMILPPKMYHRLNLIGEQSIQIQRLFHGDKRSVEYRNGVEELIQESRQKFLDSQNHTASLGYA